MRNGCTTAGIGCIECKKPVIDQMIAEIEPMRNRALELEEDPEFVRSINAEGNERARDAARETMDDVRHAMGMNYR